MHRDDFQIAGINEICGRHPGFKSNYTEGLQNQNDITEIRMILLLLN